MERIMEFMEKKFAPRANKIAKNDWIAAMQEAIFGILSLIMVGALITIASVLSEYFSMIPDLSIINTFTFGLAGLAFGFLFPYKILERKKIHEHKVSAGLSGLALYLMFIVPTFTTTEEGLNMIHMSMSRLGVEGILLGIITGILVGCVFLGIDKMNLFEESELPDFLANTFIQIIPVTIVSLIGYVIAFGLNINIYELISNIFLPLKVLGGSYLGFLLLNFLMVFLYSFGISSWILFPLSVAMLSAGIGENMELIAQGLEATNISGSSVVFAFMRIGGVGATLPLVVMMSFFAKSKRLKSIGRVSLLPGILNINEPVIYGAIVMNPYLMIPMWIIAFILATVIFIWFKLGLTTLTPIFFPLWFLPIGIQTWLIHPEISALILLLICIAIASTIWYPFFKVYDKKLVGDELEKEV